MTTHSLKKQTQSTGNTKFFPVLFALIFAFSLVGVQPIRPVAASSLVTLKAAEETYMSAASTTTNCGTSATIEIDRNLYNMRARAWVEVSNQGATGSGASWNYYGAGTGSWGTAGAANTSSDRENTNLWGAVVADFNVAGQQTFNMNPRLFFPFPKPIRLIIRPI